MTVRWRSDVPAAAAAAGIAAAGGDTRAFTACLPAIIHAQDAAAAHALVTCFGAVPGLLPEHLMLLDVAGLPAAHRRAMLAALVPDAAAWPEDQVLQTARLSARMGAYGFSFPLWRFLTQRRRAPALLEQYGFTRRERVTDVRDAALPRHDPARDLYGVGFLRQDAAWTVEYRRAYILCACHARGDAAVIVIRNSSYFFGRDRLPAPVYAAFGEIVPETLQALDADGFTGGRLSAYPQVLAAPDGLSVAEKLRRLARLVDRLDAEEQKISRWLCGAGAAHAAAFAEGVAPFYAGLISAGAPPWFPKRVGPVTPSHLATLRDGLTAETKIAFLSGANGDFPATPAGAGLDP